MLLQEILLMFKENTSVVLSSIPARFLSYNDTRDYQFNLYSIINFLHIKIYKSSLIYVNPRVEYLLSHRAPPQMADGECSPDMAGTGEIKYLK